MVGMAEWLNRLDRVDTLPVERPVVRTPAEEVDGVGATPPTTDTPPVTPEGAGTPAISKTLRDWLLYWGKGGTTLTDEMYDNFNGDEILRQVQAYDPNAMWTRTEIGGGEAGSMGMGRRLDFDITKLPTVGGPGGNNSIFDSGLIPVYDNMRLRNQEMIYDDPIFGKLTPQQNKIRDNSGLHAYAPYIAALISMGGPMAAGALANAGIGAAGLTSAVTGSGLTGGASTWWSKALAKLPSVAKAGSSFWDTPYSPRPTYQVSGINGMVNVDGMGMPIENMGTPKKPQSNDSQLVATQFADDPYGMSGG